MVISSASPFDFFPSRNSKAIAVLKVTPEELSVQYSLEALQGVDDLDEFSYTLLIVDEVCFFMYRYFQDPNQGTVVRVDRLLNGEEALGKLKTYLHLAEEDMLWTAR